MSLFTWIIAMVASLCLSENSVGENFSYEWNESGKIESSTTESTKENSFAYWYDASDYANAPNSGFSPKFWNKPIEQGGRRVYQRNDLFEATPENIARMQKGRPPVGYDGKSVNLHHLTQNEPGAIAEVGGVFHSQNTKTLHGLTEKGKSFRYSKDGKTTDAEKAFNRWKYQYWKDRSSGF